MQALVEEQVAVLVNRFPLGERAHWAAEARGLGVVVNVVAGAPRARCGVGPEHVLELAQQVGLHAEMAEVVVALGFRDGDCVAHFSAVVAMEGIALDRRGSSAFASEDLVEGVLDRGRASARRAGDGDDGVLCAHRRYCPSRNSPRVPNSGAWSGSVPANSR